MGYQARLSRARLLAASMAALVGVAACGGGDKGGARDSESNGPIPADERSVIALVFGGSQEAPWEGVKDSFSKKYGVTPQYVVAGSVEHLARVRAQTNRPQTDVMGGNDLTDAGATRSDLVVPLDKNLVTNLDALYPEAKLPTGNGVAFSYQAIGIAYNEKVFQDKGWAPPTSWRDLADPKFSGHVYGTDCSFSYTLYANSLVGQAWGGDANDLDAMKRAWTDIAKNKPTLTASAPQIEEALVSGDAYIVAWFGSSRANALRQKGAPVKFVYPREGAAAFANALDLVKGAPNPTAAQLFINEALSFEAQKAFAEQALFGPARPDVWDQLSPEIKELVPGPDDISGSAARAKSVDLDYINQHTEELVSSCESVFGG